MITVDYVWIGGKDTNYPNYIKPWTLRSKTRVIDCDYLSIDINQIPIWNYDGSSTGQASTEKSEIFIRPRRLFNNPFRYKAYIVLCDTYLDPKCEIPHESNSRFNAEKIFNEKLSEEPWFGIEQEFFLMDSTTNEPAGFNTNVKQGQFYCSVGNKNAYARDLIEKIAIASLRAGIKLSGWNAEVAPGQWEFQVGPLTGIEASDHLWILRYIMEYLTEETPYYIDYHPKPQICIDYKLNGSGAHVNFSTKEMRAENGIHAINNAIEKLAVKHKLHIENYGEYNELRLCGTCETSSINHFSSGVADRSASIRIPTETVKNSCGYFEDRRPSSIMDPYLVTSLLFKTSCL